MKVISTRISKPWGVRDFCNTLPRKAFSRHRRVAMSIGHPAKLEYVVAGNTWVWQVDFASTLERPGACNSSRSSNSCDCDTPAGLYQVLRAPAF